MNEEFPINVNFVFIHIVNILMCTIKFMVTVSLVSLKGISVVM